jgi:hypothetical protein
MPEITMEWVRSQYIANVGTSGIPPAKEKFKMKLIAQFGGAISDKNKLKIRQFANDLYRCAIRTFLVCWY